MHVGVLRPVRLKKLVIERNVATSAGTWIIHITRGTSIGSVLPVVFVNSYAHYLA